MSWGCCIHSNEPKVDRLLKIWLETWHHSCLIDTAWRRWPDFEEGLYILDGAKSNHSNNPGRRVCCLGYSLLLDLRVWHLQALADFNLIKLVLYYPYRCWLSIDYCHMLLLLHYLSAWFSFLNIPIWFDINRLGDSFHQ